MAAVKEFNWAEADLVIYPVQAVVAYPGHNGIVIRQQGLTERDGDEVINIPHHAIDRLVRRLRILQNTNVINAEEFDSAELVEIFAAE